ncbi:MAG: hypothetical protein P8130_10845 [Deltaproteobacteria bacterium]
MKADKTDGFAITFGIDRHDHAARLTVAGTMLVMASLGIGEFSKAGLQEGRFYYWSDCLRKEDRYENSRC